MPTLAFDHLSPDQRLALIGELWDSLDAGALAPSDAQKAELASRLATADRDLAQSVPWQSLRDEIAGRLP